ncbi:hypothetical protein BRADI_1g78763v3 [Brachypodium distachyon]|uniref:Uncharacterized protein n=1 Tax=Brachypodium distachyon TaxID=15368 RepID=A0A2K2DVV2_BRADI|nr:hypothetical protein BRADI_1g78763v3 [Brachypodium distachyon]
MRYYLAVHQLETQNVQVNAYDTPPWLGLKKNANAISESQRCNCTYAECRLRCYLARHQRENKKCSS